MKISKNIFAFFAAVAMVGCSGPEVVDPATPDVSGEEMIDVTMQASVGANSTKVTADLRDDMGLSFTWEDTDLIRFVPIGANKVNDLTVTSIDNWVRSTATFGGSVTANKTYRLILATDGITYANNNSKATLDLASQSSTLKQKSKEGFDKTLPDDLFLINNDNNEGVGVRKALSATTSEVPSVKFAHINSSVVFRVLFNKTSEALSGVTNFEIKSLKLNNVITKAVVDLNAVHTSANFITSKTHGNMNIAVTGGMKAEEGSAIADEYWIPVSVFPGLTDKTNATVTLEMSGTVNCSTITGHVTFDLDELMAGNAYAAGTNNAILLDVDKVMWAEVESVKAVYIKSRTDANVGFSTSIDIPYSCVDAAKAGAIEFTSSNNNIILDENSFTPDNANGIYTLNFTVKAAKAQSTTGNITIKWGDYVNETIPVYYENIHETSKAHSSVKVAGQTVNFEVPANTTYADRRFETKESALIIIDQASNFELYDNFAKGAALVGKTTITCKSTGEVWKVNDKEVARKEAFNYSVKGEGITSAFTGNFDALTKSTVYGWGTPNFDFKAGDISHNQDVGKSYIAANSHIFANTSVTLTNNADEKKAYEFDVNQYALPYIIVDGINGVTYVESTDTYYWTSTTPADCYDGGWLSSNHDNVGESLGDSPSVYNAHYKGGEQKDGGDFVWLENNSSDLSDYTGGSTGLKYVFDAVAPQDKKVAANQYSFWGKVNDKSSQKDKKYKADFDLRITNDANEEIHFVITYLRYDK